MDKTAHITRLQNDPSGRARKEDNLIAWTFDQYRLNMTGGDFVAQCPMTKVHLLYRPIYIHFLWYLKPASRSGPTAHWV